MLRKNKIKFNFIELGRCSFTFNNDKGMINIYDDIVLPLIDKHGCTHIIDMVEFDIIFDTISRNITNMTLLSKSKHENYFLHISGEVVYVDNRSKEDKKELNYITTIQNDKQVYTNDPYIIQGFNSYFKANSLYIKMNDLLDLLEDKISNHLINFRTSLLTKEQYEEIVGTV